ncbi:MAG: WG repeat-containing protein [Saprospiraceae bacterium]|nr:WG repeat-containing protein [Saprospiraceae bacterium]
MMPLLIPYNIQTSTNTMQEKIIETFKAYTHALYRPDWDAVIASLYPPDVLKLHTVCTALMDLISPFGEQKEFLRFFPGVENPEAIKSLTPEAFAVLFLSGAMNKVAKEQRIQLIETTSIDRVTVSGNHAQIAYSFLMSMEGETFPVDREADMVLENGTWYVRIRAGFDQVLERFQQDIDLYNDRKSKDHIPKEPVDDDDLKPFALYGYRSWETGRTVLEPRFKSAGVFSEGLAAVSIFSKFGYIDKQGEIAIKPEFVSAEAFSEGLAVVSLYDDAHHEKYGYLNRAGELVIAPQYEAASGFSEGLAAVKQDGLWGYITPSGKEKIGFHFLEAGDFMGKTAQVTVATEDGEKELEIDRKGKVVG